MSRAVWAVVAATAAMSLMGPSGVVGSAAAQGASVVPAAQCQPGDHPEANDPTGLQGQVPWSDRLSGRAAQGYSCNLKLTGSYKGTGAFATLDTYKNCAYYGDSGEEGGTVVVDASDPADPVKTDYLTTPAMLNPWESLRVNAKRGLLVAGRNATQYLDVYDVATDCRRPRLLFSGEMPNAGGHEGWFSPDGLVYYMSAGRDVWPIDLSDPRHPKEMATWTFPSGIHGGSISDDGTRGYFCQWLDPGPEEVLVVDTSEVQERRREPEYHVLGRVPLVDNLGCQATYPVTYGGHPYVIQYGELGRGVQSAAAPVLLGTPAGAAAIVNKCPNGTDTNFSAPHIIDLQSLKVVSTLLLQVDDPANCPLVSGDHYGPAENDTSGSFKSLVGALFVYDVHHCSPDRLHDPTILACAQFGAGIRVYDIRDPLEPRELAYYNVGTLSAGSTGIDAAGSRPVVRTDRGAIWFTTAYGGFHVAKFENGVWPFGDMSCPAPGRDYYLDHYRLQSDCGTVPAGTTSSAGPSLGLPSTKRCVSRRAFRIRLRAPRGERLRSARVYVNGKRVRVLSGKRLRAPVNLRGLPAGTVNVTVAATTRSGRTIRRSRTYRTCVKRGPRPKDRAAG